MLHRRPPYPWSTQPHPSLSTHYFFSVGPFRTPPPPPYRQWFCTYGLHHRQTGYSPLGHGHRNSLLQQPFPIPTYFHIHSQERRRPLRCTHRRNNGSKEYPAPNPTLPSNPSRGYQCRCETRTSCFPHRKYNLTIDINAGTDSRLWINPDYCKSLLLGENRCGDGGAVCSEYRRVSYLRYV